MKIKEIWKPIKKYKDWYEVSNLGRIRSIDRTVLFKNGASRTYSGKILKQRYHNGYALVNLNKNKKMESHYVHKLVAAAFIEKDDTKLWINHINGIKSDNRAINLERCTPGENNKHAVLNGLRKNNISGLKEWNSSREIPVVAIRNNKIIKIEDTSRLMAEYLIKKDIIRDVSVETAARAIRHAIKDSKSYKGIFFEKMD